MALILIRQLRSIEMCDIFRHANKLKSYMNPKDIGQLRSISWRLKAGYIAYRGASGGKRFLLSRCLVAFAVLLFKARTLLHYC